MVGLIVKELLEDLKTVSDAVQDRIYPVIVPENNLQTPCISYRVVDGNNATTTKNTGPLSVDMQASIRIMSNKYSDIDKLSSVIISNFIIAKGYINKKRVTSIMLLNSEDLFTEKEQCYINDLTFNFRINL